MVVCGEGIDPSSFSFAYFKEVCPFKAIILLHGSFAFRKFLFACIFPQLFVLAALQFMNDFFPYYLYKYKIRLPLQVIPL